MGNNKLILGLVLLLIFGLSNLQAQEASTTAGSEAIGSGGSASYTIGQVVYTFNTGTNGSVAQGVQQPYEISVITSIEEAKNISLEVSAYPNPTTDYLILEVNNFGLSTLHFQLYDINGKLLQSIKANGQETRIETSQLVPSNYLVKVLDNKKEIKTFKIVKTN